MNQRSARAEIRNPLLALPAAQMVNLSAWVCEQLRKLG